MSEDRRAGGVSPPGDVEVVRLPPTTGSVITPEQLEGLEGAVEAAASRSPSMLLLAGSSAGRFGTGLSMEALRRPGGRGEEYLRPLQAASIPLIRRLAAFPAPTGALLEGPVLGPHLTLALLCDVRGAVPGERTLLGYPEPGLGMLPVLGGVPCLGRVTGPVRAVRLLVSGRRVSAPEALRLGLVDVLLEGGRALEEMAEWMEGQGRKAARGRKRPRRYPQGKTWADAFLEGTGIGRRWLFRRLARRLEGIMTDGMLRDALLEGLREGLEEELLDAIAHARDRAAESARREPADNALSVFTMREWARKGDARWETPQDAARKLQGAWYREGLALLLDGMRIEGVDAAARRHGMGAGPCRLMDRNGLGQVVSMVRETAERLPDPVIDDPVERLAALLLEEEMSGGQRFYRYGEGRPEPEQRIYHLVDEVREREPPMRPDSGEAARRLVLALAAAASRGIDEDHPAWMWDLTALTVLEWEATGAGPLRRTERQEAALLEQAPLLAERWGQRLEVTRPPGGSRWFPRWPLTSAAPEDPHASSPR